jgi:hypothetical protein
VLETLPSQNRNAFLMVVAVPTVVTSGDASYNRMQDQSGSSAVSLGGGAVRANNSPRWRLVRRARQSPGDVPGYRIAGRSEGPGPHLRGGNGADRRRRVQRHRTLRQQPMAENTNAPSTGLDLASLGFSSAFVNQIVAPKMPTGLVDGQGEIGGGLFNRSFGDPIASTTTSTPRPTSRRRRSRWGPGRGPTRGSGRRSARISTSRSQSV